MKSQKILQLMRDNAQQSPRQPVKMVRNDTANEATLYVYDIIDAWWGIAAKDVAREIAALPRDATLHVRINSPGGDVFEARAIRTAIQQHPGQTIAHIDGLAASAATTIADAANQVEISPGGFYMIHNAWTLSVGNKHDMLSAASLLDKVDAAIRADFATRTGKTDAEITAWMDAETWFTAEEAVANGFAHRLAAAAEPAAKAGAWNLSAYSKAPKALTDPPASPAAQDLQNNAAAQRALNERRLRLLQID